MSPDGNRQMNQFIVKLGQEKLNLSIGNGREGLIDSASIGQKGILSNSAAKIIGILNE
jgi:hypothetical protein